MSANSSAASLNRFAPQAIQLAFAAAVLLLWQASVSFGWVDTLFLASPVATADAFVRTAREAAPHLEATFMAFFVALAVGVFAALVIGLLINASRYSHQVFAPILVVGVIIPKVTLLPLFVLWFGIDHATVIVYGALSAFFPMAVNVSAASQEIKPTQITLAKAMGYSRVQTYQKVVLPAMLPVLVSGLFYACNAALMGVFIVELALARFGIGAFIRDLATTFRTPELYAAIVITAAITVVINVSLWVIARRLGRWRA
jgi:ABC-type nitrate/sulfonate/bicarbonate transport system permease component